MLVATRSVGCFPGDRCPPYILAHLLVICGSIIVTQRKPGKVRGITQGHRARKLESEYKPTDPVYNCAVNLGI